jgi:hypothetical protein
MEMESGRPGVHVVSADISKFKFRCLNYESMSKEMSTTYSVPSARQILKAQRTEIAKGVCASDLLSSLVD